MPNTDPGFNYTTGSGIFETIILRLEETAKALKANDLENEADIVSVHLYKLRTPEYRKRAIANPEFAKDVIDTFVKDFA